MERLYALNDEERKATLRQRLVEDCHVVVHPLLELGAFNPNIVPWLPLLDRSVMGAELANQAEAIFYGKNSFLVWWDALQEFLSPANGMPTDKLVKHVIVRYNLQELQASGRNLATELQHLLRLTNAELVAVDIAGGGAPDGSDLQTQVVLRDIASIVDRLISHFGPRFVIGRSLGEWPALYNIKWASFKSYWQKPAPSARERSKSSEASFEETMQLQVESWIQAAQTPEWSPPLCGISETDAPPFDAPPFGWRSCSDKLTECISTGMVQNSLA
ncbi:hypothetical protein IF1G_11209 [Cordyceps javanica]|uniref:Uncharacterized protein n=1 Tax=Cordyceps javanica TaxID=43265 RepID=A0A545UKZ0_9HYPO|nr:hypothetical protein IF1G_11209 [Cordyceps javanica]